MPSFLQGLCKWDVRNRREKCQTVAEAVFGLSRWSGSEQKWATVSRS